MAILRNQRGNNDCGPTCFSNALNLLGYDIKISKANQMCNLTKDGTDSDDLIRAFNRYGFDGKEKVFYKEKKAWQWIIKDTQRGLPVILSVDDDSHWILVLRAGRRGVQVFDPDDAYPTKITKSELLLRWRFLDGEKDIFKFHGLAFVPFKDKAIKAVLVREMTLKTIDVG